MPPTLHQLGSMVQTFRSDKGLTQSQLGEAIRPSTNRSAIAHLEQGLRVPDSNTLRSICQFLALPGAYWEAFLRKQHESSAELHEWMKAPLGKDHGSLFMDWVDSLPTPDETDPKYQQLKGLLQMPRDER